MNIAGCTVVVSVDSDGGLERQVEVLAAVRAVERDFALLTVDALRVGAVVEAWEVVDGDAASSSLGGPAAAAPPVAKGGATQAWLAAVKASGGPPPLPAGGPGPDPLVPPPPPPPATAAHPAPLGAAAGPAASAGPAPSPARAKTMPAVPTTAAADQAHPATPTYHPEDWDARLAAAEEHGAAVAEALAAHRVPPSQLVHPSPLRNRVWAAVGGAAERVGLYSRWDHGAETALRGALPCTVRGFPSLAEARAFARGAGVAELPDRR